MSAQPATYRSLLADGEFRALWLAQAISLTGDQLARVAIAFLVYSRTGSALATATVYAITYLPWLIGGPLLGGLADRYPRRTVMVTCQLISAALVALMAIPGTPLVVLGALLFVVILVESPFLSARASLLVDVLPDDRYVLASGLGQLTIQGTQVLGFALGGLLLTVVGATDALLLDAGSFLFAAALVQFFVRHRGSAATAADLGGSWHRIREGARVAFGDPRLRGLVLLAWLSFFWVVPEALAAPYGKGDPTAIGLLLAAQPTGAVVGGLALTRLVRPVVRLQLMGALALLASRAAAVLRLHTAAAGGDRAAGGLRGRHVVQPAGERRLHAGRARRAAGAGFRPGRRRAGRRPGGEHRPRRRARRGGRLGRRGHRGRRCARHGRRARARRRRASLPVDAGPGGQLTRPGIDPYRLAVAPDGAVPPNGCIPTLFATVRGGAPAGARLHTTHSREGVTPVSADTTGWG